MTWVDATTLESEDRLLLLAPPSVSLILYLITGFSIENYKSKGGRRRRRVGCIRWGCPGQGSPGTAVARARDGLMMLFPPPLYVCFMTSWLVLFCVALSATGDPLRRIGPGLGGVQREPQQSYVRNETRVLVRGGTERESR